MISSIFNTLFYQPLYNGFVFLVSVAPFNDVGIAIILLTIFVRLIISPLTHKSTKAQARIKELEPEISKIKKETEKDKQAQAKRVMELYQKHGVSPFSGCLLFIIQIPFILALFWIFNKGFSDGFDKELLYSFVTSPVTQSTIFLGIIDLGKRSFFLALFAGVSQYFQIKLVMPAIKKEDPSKPHTPSFKDEFVKNLQLQMKYIFPVMVFFLSYTTFTSAVALYWCTSNLFSIGHELFVKRKTRAISSTESQNPNTNTAV